LNPLDDAVALVERPLPDSLDANEAGVGEDAQVLAGGGLADAELLGDEDAANAVAHQVSVDLRREVN
jgi:hypothetical protein